MSGVILGRYVDGSGVAHLVELAVDSYGQVRGIGLVNSGQNAEGAPTLNWPVRVAGKIRTVMPYIGGAGTGSDLTMTTSGALVIKPYSPPDADWLFAAPAGGIVNNTAVVLKAAATGLRQYMTGFDVFNAHTSVATEIVVLDGATVIWRTLLPPGGRLAPDFNVPLRSTAGAALSIQALTAAQIYVNAAGYSAA